MFALDGCNEDCSGPATGFLCTNHGIYESTTCEGICGDGVRTEDEACDDGRTGDLSGCDEDCDIPPKEGWNCTDYPAFQNFLTYSDCVPICADGLRVGAEVCDDGADDGSGCDSSCSGELEGYSCSYDNGTPDASCSPICGDGKLVTEENCDDGFTGEDSNC